MKRTDILIRSMDQHIKVLGHLMSELGHELDKTAKDLQQEFPIYATGLRTDGKATKGRRSA